MVQCGQVYIKNETTDKYVKVEDMNEKNIKVIINQFMKKII